MYKIIEVNGDKVSLDNEEFKDYLVEALRSRGAKIEDIEEVKEDIHKLKSNEKHTVYFDAKEVFTLIKDDAEKEDWIVELTESNSEIWSSDIDCNSREEAIEEGMKAAKEDGLESFRIGRQEYCSMAHIDAGTVIENAQEQLYDEVGEVSETYLEDVTDEQQKELEEALNNVFHDWHKKHKLFPNCYRILNDEVIEVR
ncbi:hypothetical protein [Clostridium sp. C2-6-12]|uniref:hypothetical protein n=1 Tax=Clostridium sp. C2-6-12 TaxID=2698832 RepID=UPI001FADF776|nr:hypothetical protein [Clostridium sp. C2-6-12]